MKRELLTLVADQNSAGSDVVLLGHLLHALLLEERAASAAKRAVCLDQNVLLLAEVDDLLLRQVGVVLDLVRSGDNRGILQQRLVEESIVTQGQLQRALDSRVVIEQAKGYIAQRHNLDMDAAFQLIRSHARSTQTKLSDVAGEIIVGRLSL